MQSRRGLRPGFKLIDLMVGVLVSGVLLALILAWLGHCEAARRAQCWSNMRQVGLALLEYQNANGHYPNAGTFRDPRHVHQGDPLRSSIYRSIVRPGSYAGNTTPWLHSWVVDVLPYLGAQDLYNAWDLTGDYLVAAACSSGRRRAALGRRPRTWRASLA